MKDTNKLYGVNTEDAIGTGLFKGYIHVINGFIKEFKDNYKDIKVIGTGNGVRVFEKYLNLDISPENPPSGQSVAEYLEFVIGTPFNTLVFTNLPSI